MKLTEVSVDGYGVCNNLRLQSFDRELNVVFGRSGSGKSTLQRYIRNVLFGFGSESELGHGALEFSANGQSCRLIRTIGSRGELVVSDIQGSQCNHEFGYVHQAISAIGADVFDRVFTSSACGQVLDLVKIANVNSGVPFGRVAVTGNAVEVSLSENRVRESQRQLASIDSRITEREQRRLELNHRIDELEFSNRGRTSDVEAELRLLADQ